MADRSHLARRFIGKALVWLLLVAFVTSLSTAATASEEPTSGDEIAIQPFVYNGDDTTNPGWVTSIVDSGFYICSGSLVHPQWVLTAAHCVAGGVSGYTINVGDDQWYQGSSRQITQVNIHPGYDGSLSSVDLAMVRLSSPVSGTPLPVLASSPSWPLFDQPLVVAGWGLTFDGSGVPDVLQSAGVWVNSDPTVGAQGSFCPEEAVAPSGYDDFCYGGVSWGCSGDSGGPLVGYASPQHDSGAVQTIYGVTSFGDASSCSGAQFDTVAQGVGRHYHWIRGFFVTSPGLGDEMFFYRNDGLYRYYDVRNDASLSTPILAGDNYTTDWSTITGIDLDGDGHDEMFFYRSDGLYRYYDVRPDGTLPTPLRAGDNYTKDWSSITAVDLDGDGQDEMFFYRSDGLYRYYDVRSDGSIGSPIRAGDNYTSGWEPITAVDLDGDGQDEMFFYRDDGLYRYYEVEADGSLPKPMRAGDSYTTGWSAITALDLEADGQDEMFFYRNDGLYRYYNVRPDGSIGSPILAGSNYTNGWDSITAVDLSD